MQTFLVHFGQLIIAFHAQKSVKHSNFIIRKDVKNVSCLAMKQKNNSWSEKRQNVPNFVVSGCVCDRGSLMSNGCCNSNSSSSFKFSCDGCKNSTGCCDKFEFCISCCMNPINVSYSYRFDINFQNIFITCIFIAERRAYVRVKWGQRFEQFASVERFRSIWALPRKMQNQFQVRELQKKSAEWNVKKISLLFLHFRSVQHENLYIDPQMKYCYSKGPSTVESNSEP